MHISFAISFFLFVGLSETLRHGVFGLSPSETNGILVGILLLAALLFLRGDVIYLFREPADKHRIRRASGPWVTWSWKRSVLGLFLSPLVLVGPLIWGIALIQINFRMPDDIFPSTTAVFDILLLALACELFFRETVIKAFRGQKGPVILASSLAYFTFWMPSGLETAVMAAGSGLFFLTLRLIGTNILLVAGVHAALALLWGHVLSLGQTAVPDLQFAVFYLGCAALVSLVLHYLFAETEQGYLHA